MKSLEGTRTRAGAGVLRDQLGLRVAGKVTGD